MKLFVVDPHTIYRRGLVACLEGLAEMDSVGHAGSVREAREDRAPIADGHAIREVAQQLCYSERTVKSVLHDVVTKLNARSRSQAVAHAVREGLI